MSVVSSEVFASSLFPRQHLLRAEQLDCLVIDRVVDPDSPEDVLSLLLAARPKLGRKRLVLPAIVRKVNVEHHVAIHDVAAVEARPALNVLVSSSV